MNSGRKRARSAELPLGANPVCFHEPSGSSALLLNRRSRRKEALISFGPGFPKCLSLLTSAPTRVGRGVLTAPSSDVPTSYPQQHSRRREDTPPYLPGTREASWTAPVLWRFRDAFELSKAAE